MRKRSPTCADCAAGPLCYWVSVQGANLCATCAGRRIDDLANLERAHVGMRALSLVMVWGWAEMQAQVNIIARADQLGLDNLSAQAEGMYRALALVEVISAGALRVVRR